MGSSSSVPSVWVVADGPTAGGSARLVEQVQRALDGAAPGTLAVVDRDLPPSLGGPEDRDRLQRLERLRAVTAAAAAWLVVTARVDLALAASADGVQLPERGLPADVVRRHFPALRVGRSCHDLAGAVRAAAAGAHWTVLAPIHAPTSKPLAPGTRPLGLHGLAEVTERLAIPVVALGGITTARAPAIRAAGAAAVASLGGVLLAADPRAAVAALVAAAGGGPS